MTTSLSNFNNGGASDAELLGEVYGAFASKVALPYGHDVALGELLLLSNVRQVGKV